MADRGAYRLDHLWRVRIMRAGVPWSRIVEDPVFELETSIGKFELKVVALSSRTKKKAKKRYRLRRGVAGRKSAEGEGWYGIVINLETGRIAARGIIPEWIKGYIASFTNGRSRTRR